ncbi:MAG: mandelate racemase/muconate lactonizing enzyme family protein [Paracoccaceae bacterium]|jgi:D(-)-tartrate dehydratase|nr:mandelate racemase/muconate lactonizing enzyme family protein [Paracoccaceae bacterium]
MASIVDIRCAVVPIASAISNAYIDFSKMTASVVALISDIQCDGRPVIGYGFNSNGRYAPDGLLRERFIPHLQGHDFNGIIDPEPAWTSMMSNEKPGGHGERSTAVGVLDMALWDLAAKLEDKPLYQLIADKWRDGQVDDSVFVYAAGGYYHPGKDLSALKAEMQSYRDRGYRVCKMKIGNSLEEDIPRIEAALEVVGTGQNLAVDANGRFDLDTAIAYAEAMKQYDLFWYEEAGDPLDYDLQRQLADHYDGPMATGENLFSHQDARNLLRYGGMRPDRDWLQIDCALSYGLVEYKRILDLLPEYGFTNRNCIPHGGHQMSLNIAAGLGLGGNESYPDVFAPFGGFSDETPVEDSQVGLHQCAGVGFEEKQKLISSLRAATET